MTRHDRPAMYNLALNWRVTNSLQNQQGHARFAGTRDPLSLPVVATWMKSLRAKKIFRTCGGGVDSIHLFKEILSHPKLDIFRGVQGYSLRDSKSVDTPVSQENWLYFTMQKNILFLLFSWVKTQNQPPPIKLRLN